MAALVALVTVGLSGCADDQDDYCGAFLDSREELSELATRQAASKGSVDVLTPSVAAFEDLRDRAPAELRDEWDTVVFAYEDLADAVRRTGVDPGEFVVGEVPEGLTATDRRALARVAGKLGSPRVVEAVSGIEAYSAQVCEEEPSGDGS